MQTELVTCPNGHRHHVRFDACPYCELQAEAEAEIARVKQALEGATIKRVGMAVTQHGRPTAFELFLGDGTRVSFDFWADYADSSGLSIEVNGERVFGKGY